MNDRVAEYYALTYDASVADWPGELEFYLSLARTAPAGSETLELAAGTGRIAIRLAQAGIAVTALDLSPWMLAVGREKSAGLSNIRWIEADMRTFGLDREFALVIVPGHSFQNLLTPEDQLDCLVRARRHLRPEGHLVLHLDHQDIDWLGDLTRSLGGVFEPAETFLNVRTGRQVRTSRAWTYERSSQTATVTTRWDELDDRSRVAERIETEPKRIHCAFRFEVEHLLARSGFKVEATHGDFLGAGLSEDSSEMIWVAKVRSDGAG